MSRSRFAVTAAGGCILLLILLVVAGSLLFTSFFQITSRQVSEGGVGITPDTRPVSGPRPTLTLIPQNGQGSFNQAEGQVQSPGGRPADLTALYDRFNPGVVNIQVYVDRVVQSGQGAGSGFILDDRGHIVTNNHVVAEASAVTVVFYNGLEVEADVIGTDADSDLAVLKVDQLAEGAHFLPLADSDQVRVGQWVAAIGNPFQLGGSMSVGIVSAVGRTIPSGATPFSIPQAIQTDAAINPGNSGGPLLNLAGEVIGVNAQIRTNGVPGNVGVGFAIPSNIVRRVAPSLIERGYYSWPWLGASGGSVSLAVKAANDLPSQNGAYITEVIPDSPADQGGLRGSTGAREIQGLTVPVGGDVVIEVDGERVVDFADLLVQIIARTPGDRMEVTILRNGQRRQATITLEPRPANFGP